MGNGKPMHPTLKGRHIRNSLGPFRPFRADLLSDDFSQGVALGWLVAARWA